MPVCCDNVKLERSLPSDERAAQHFVDDVLQILRNGNWPESDIFAIHLALEEALVNAIEHGNRNDRARQVKVAIDISAQRFWVRVADEGTGFDPLRVPDPTDAEHLTEPHGRGVLLMRRLMNRVRFNTRGNEVEMEKDRSADFAFEMNGVARLAARLWCRAAAI
jgi:serine/threonine-protein kinase RsbW